MEVWLIIHELFKQRVEASLCNESIQQREETSRSQND
jgi:hypothetical protein